MQPISENDVRARIARDNPWWGNSSYIAPEAANPRRVYYLPFKALALNFEVRRAAVLLGPRRVGKTFMIKQLIHDAILGGMNPQHVLYVSIDTPIYSGMSLEKFLSYMPVTANDGDCLVVYDEIQYHREWETHLKDLVDHRPRTKFIASGSAAAALRLKSKESGAGRFSDFMLPPLTFYEFLLFLGEEEKYIARAPKDVEGQPHYEIKDIEGLNARFIDYLNFGGYPEAVTNDAIKKNPEQFIKNDIIDKVLLKDLPSLYGIADIQELNRLFAVLAYNAGNEASLENISKDAGITKPTIKRYIEYLESAFLIIKVSTVDENCRTMQRARNFKVYLNNPSMRAALFAPVSADDSHQVGRLAESAIFSQWQHSRNFQTLKYARWRDGEVDIVCIGPSDQKPLWIGEIKWSDRVADNLHGEAASLATLLRRHPTIKESFFTTKTVESDTTLEGRRLRLWPSAAYCYFVGRNITSYLSIPAVSMAAKE
jgi:predicted AAA+ superfamily ATPase